MDLLTQVTPPSPLPLLLPARCGPRRPLDRRLASLGFSLVELLVVVTIVGVLAGLSIPKIAKMSNESTVQRASQTLRNEVQFAYAIAGRNRVPVRLRWISGAMQLQVTNLTGSTVYRRTGVGTRTFGLAAADITVTPATLTVFPNGLASDSLVIAVARNGYSRTVRVSRSGMVRSQ